MIDPHDEEYDADLEECLDWQSNYLQSGRRRDVLIKWLTARPMDASIVTADIVQFLQSRQERLEKEPLREIMKEEIYAMFTTGDFLGCSAFGKVEGWKNLSTKMKINKIVSLYPQFKGNESGLENIISEQKKLRSQE